LRAVLRCADGCAHAFGREEGAPSAPYFVPGLKAGTCTFFTAMVTHLEMNGLMWECGEVEETAIVLRAAAREMQHQNRVRNALGGVPAFGQVESDDPERE